MSPVFRRLLFLCATLTAIPVLASERAIPVEHEIGSRGDVQLEVFAQGRGPVIVILPSLGRSGRDYDAVAANLAADGFRVIRPEPRGVELSKGPLDNLSIHDFAADVAAVVEHENKGPVVVVGHAWGNFVARMLATDRPDLVNGVVVAAASAGKVPAGSKEMPISVEMRNAIDGAGDLSLSEAQRLDDLRIAFFAPGNDPRVWLSGWFPEANKAESHARNITPVDVYFAAGRAPILDLQAEDDAVSPRRFSNVFKSMLGDRVTVVVIRHAGHALAPEQPETMSRAIATFAKRVYAAD